MENKKERVIIIDIFNIWYQQLQKNTAKDLNAQPIGAFVGTINFIQKVCSKFHATKCYAVFDGPNAGFRRKQIHKEYKDKRGRKSGRLVTVKITEDITETLNNEDYQMSLLIESLQALPVKIITTDFYEADDLIAYIAEQHSEDICYICSMDKDYLQLVKEDCYVYSPQKQILFTAKEVQEKFGVPVENLIYYRCIIGDSSDKLIGLKGFKETTLFELFPIIKEEIFPDLNSFITKISSVEGKGKNIEKLHQSKDQLVLMYSLMKLCGDNLSAKAQRVVDDQVEQQEGKVCSKFAFKQLSYKTRLVSFIKDYDLWYRPFSFLS